MIKLYNYKTYLKAKLSGISNLEKSNSLKEVDKIRKIFFNLALDVDKSRLNSFFFKDQDDASLVLTNNIKNIFIEDRNQFYVSLGDQILGSFAKKKYKTKFILPINKSLRDKCKSKIDINFNDKLCDIFFFFNILLNLVKGLVFGLIIFFDNIKEFFLKKHPYKKSIFFDLSATPEELINNKNSNYIITKYINTLIDKKKNFFFYLIDKKKNFFSNKFSSKIYKDIDSNQFLFVKNIYPHLSILKNFKFIGYVLFSFFFAIILLLKKNWYPSFLFLEIVKASIFRNANKDDISDDYVLSYKKSISRALWSLEIEKYSKKTTLVMYSLNSFGHKFKNGYEAKDPSALYLQIYTRYIIWDQLHMNLLEKSFSKKDKIEIFKLGPITMNTGSSVLKNNDKYLCIFDITPFRKSLDEITEPSIIKPEYIIKFLNDIIEISNKIDLKIYLKTKKDLSKNMYVSKLYRKQILDIARKEKQVNLIETDVSIEELISNSIGVVSYPYTSTASIASYLNKPSVFYDPSKKLDDKDLVFSKGIKILNKKDLLENWISGLV